MKKSLLNSLLLLLSVCLLISCCKDDDKPQPADPCRNSYATSAVFKIEEEISGGGKIRRFEVDTIVNSYRPIYFTALQEADEYEWKVGADTTIYRTRSFQLQFPQAVGKVEIRLIVKKKPDSTCFPGDDGVDTVVHRIFVGTNAHSPLNGIYEGYNVSDPQQKFQVVIDLTGPFNPNFGIRNLPRGCPYPISSADWGFRAAYIYTSWNECKKIKAWAVKTMGSNEITINYEYFIFKNNDPSSGKGEWKTDTFRGMKI